MNLLLGDIRFINKTTDFTKISNQKKLNKIKENEISQLNINFKQFRSTKYHLTNIDPSHKCDLLCTQKEYVYTISAEYNLFSCIKSGLVHECKCDENCKFKFVDKNTYIMCILSKRILGRNIDNEIFKKQKNNYEEKVDDTCEIENEENEHYEVFESKNYQTGLKKPIIKEEKEEEKEKNLLNSINFNFIFNDNNQLNQLKIEENEIKEKNIEINKKSNFNSTKRRRVRTKINEEIVINLEIHSNENEKQIIESISRNPTIIKNKKIAKKRKKQIQTLTRTPKRRKYNKTDKLFQKMKSDNITDIENILYDILFNDSQRIRIEKKKSTELKNQAVSVIVKYYKYCNKNKYIPNLNHIDNIYDHFMNKRKKLAILVYDKKKLIYYKTIILILLKYMTKSDYWKKHQSKFHIKNHVLGSLYIMQMNFKITFKELVINGENDINITDNSDKLTETLLFEKDIFLYENLLAPDELKELECSVNPTWNFTKNGMTEGKKQIKNCLNTIIENIDKINLIDEIKAITENLFQ